MLRRGETASLNCYERVPIGELFERTCNSGGVARMESDGPFPLR